MQITVFVNNSYSRIEGLTRDLYAGLRTELSYKDDPSAAFYSPYGQKTHYLLDKHSTFPTGLLSRVYRFLDNRNIKYSIKLEVEAPAPFFVKNESKLDPNLYMAQKRAISVAIERGRGTLCLPTGAGKSRVIAALAQLYGLSTIIITPNLELKRQLTEVIETYAGENTDITVENIDSSALNAPSKKYDLLIIDEAHHVAAKTYQRLNKTAWKDIHYRFFFTATPFRNQNNEQLLFEAIAGEVIYKLSYTSAIKNSYIVPVEAFYVESPKIKTDAYTWPQVYSSLIVNNVERNQLLTKLITELVNNKKATLCLVKEIKHGEILAKSSGLPFANGQDENSRQHIADFNTGKIHGLIGTTGIIGEGVDTKPCEFVIIAGLGKAKSAFMQQVGRAVRVFKDKVSAKVILIKDRSHKFTMRHFNAQKKILKEEYGIEVLKLD